MTDPKQKAKPVLRTPRPKGELPEFKIRPALSLPHDSLLSERSPLPPDNPIVEAGPSVGYLAGNSSGSSADASAGNPDSQTIEQPVEQPETKETKTITSGYSAEPSPGNSVGNSLGHSANYSASISAGTSARYSSGYSAGASVSLDSTHTPSEQLIYSWMYRLTVTAGINPRRFKQDEIMRGTGIRSTDTLTRALKGLIAKLSIKVASKDGANRYGVQYLVCEPREIFRSRTKFAIEIDPSSKQILGASAGYLAGYSSGSSARNSAGRSARRSAGDTARTSMGNSDIEQPALRNPNNQRAHDYINIRAGISHAELSSVPAHNDDEKLDQVRQLFDRLSGGGTWKDERDLKSYAEISQVPTWHIILGLCYSVGRSSEHKMNSLAYAVPSILDHYRDMGIFPESQMIEIAYRTMRKTLLCIQTGKWTVPEWEQ